MGFLNIPLMKRPANWIKVFLMVFIGAMVVHIAQTQRAA
jgi:hypothetical protein